MFFNTIILNKMEQKKFNPKDFLGATVLSPLESTELKGGMADDAITTIKTVEKVVEVVTTVTD
jgi:hypothetical protein